jgi:hypothetical protein
MRRRVSSLSASSRAVRARAIPEPHLTQGQQGKQ